MGPWSLDARVLVRPSRAFQTLAGGEQDAPGDRTGFWLAARRPLFLTFVLACVVSLLATSVASLRLIAPTAIYWSFVPLVEILALVIVVWRRRAGRGLAYLIDTFFAGHAAWTLLLLAVGATMAVASPAHWWFLITRPVIVAIVIVIGWSAYVDVCFFRYICGARLSRSIGLVALNRFIAWLLIFWIFAVPEATPLGVFQELAEAVLEVAQ